MGTSKGIFSKNNQLKYQGKYVATSDFNNKNVISHGDTFMKAYNDAIKLGIKEPVVAYIPDIDSVNIF
jgi:hypothetical protein